VACIIVVRAERAEENYWSSWLGEGVSRGGEVRHSLSLLVRLGQSASCQCGRGLLLWRDGGPRDIIIGAWSDPLDERVDASHQRKLEKWYGLAKPMSIALSLWVTVKGNRVYTPGVLRRVKPRSVARSK